MRERHVVLKWRAVNKLAGEGRAQRKITHRAMCKDIFQVWIVQVTPPNARDRPQQSFCVAAADASTARALVKEHITIAGSTSADSTRVEPLVQLTADTALGIAEALGLKPGGVLPWPIDGSLFQLTEAWRKNGHS